MSGELRVPSPVFTDTMPKEGFVRLLPSDGRGTWPRGVREGVARAAFAEYERQYGGRQSFERLHERGGFSVAELVALLTEAQMRQGGHPTRAAGASRSVTTNPGKEGLEGIEQP